MEKMIINDIEFVKESDYLDAPSDVKINHILVDIQSGKKTTHKMMNVSEKEKRNAAFRKAGEKFSVWCPALFV